MHRFDRQESIMQGRNSASSILDPEQKKKQRLRMIRNCGIVLLVVVLIISAVNLIRYLTRSHAINQYALPCFSHQDVTVFRDGVLYYDGDSIHFLNANGSVVWSYPVGQDASFSVSDEYMIAWSGTQLFIVNANGRPTYNEPMTSEIQFARISNSRAAIILGDEIAPQLLMVDVNGQLLDSEQSVFDGMMLLDCGFFGNNEEYCWTLSMDAYSPALATYLHTFQVDKMNTGNVNLGDNLVYKVFYADSKLHVFTTQQLNIYDYRGVQDTNETELIYGWRLMDYNLSTRGTPQMLFGPTDQTSGTPSITELRILSSSLDQHFTLPTTCVGAALMGNRLYAFAPEYLFTSTLNTQRFVPYSSPLPGGRTISSLIGITSNGYAIVTCGAEVYSISLPQ